MITNLILSVDRRNTPEQAKEALDIALKYKGQGVVGLDLCGDPSKGDISIFTPVLTQAKASGLGITLHFAEIPVPEDPVLKGELQTLLSWKPDRLGHVIHVPDDLKKEIIEGGIGVELCLSCNVLAKMMKHGTEGFGDHHFGWWWEQGKGEGEGIAVSVSSLVRVLFVDLWCYALCDCVLWSRSSQKACGLSSFPSLTSLSFQTTLFWIDPQLIHLAYHRPMMLEYLAQIYPTNITSSRNISTSTKAKFAGWREER